MKGRSKQPMASKRRVIVTGGGTAGHVLPAFAVAEALMRAGIAPGSILYVGARHGLEARLASPEGVSVVLLPGRGIERRLTPANFCALAGLSAGFVRALRLVLAPRALLVVSVGGYAGLSVALAGAIVGVPVVVVNVDAKPGAVNRLLGRFARASYVAFSGSGLPRAELTGAPVRQQVLAVRRDAATKAGVRERLGLDPRVRLVVVAGGSLGAASLNEVAVGLRGRLAGREDAAIVHVCGERNLKAMQARASSFESGLESSAPAYLLLGYTESLPELFGAADLVVCRAGAMTVAELCVIGVASVLVPLPGAPGDHQSENARTLVDAGAAVLVPDDKDCVARASDAVLRLLDDERARDQMDMAAASLGRREASDEIARRVVSLIKKEPVPH